MLSDNVLTDIVQNIVMLRVLTQSIVMLIIRMANAEWFQNNVMMSVIMLSVMLSVVIICVIMLSVFILSFIQNSAWCHYSDCLYTCCIMIRVIWQSVEAPNRQPCRLKSSFNKVNRLGLPIEFEVKGYLAKE
jgi:hypothetical protein